ncbi:MAG TPA: LytTR family DNA-binding domain-containing protein [Pelobium sp.]
MKVVLVDDETHCIETLEIMLNGFQNKVEIIGKFSHPLVALDFIKTNEFDILFLDIEMPELSGFDLLSQVQSFNFDVVFITAYNKYAIKAFQYSALNYLLKPVDTAELLACLHQWELKAVKPLNTAQLTFLMDLFQNTNRGAFKIAFPTTLGLEFIEISEIIRCQSDSNYTNVYLKKSKPLLICRTLKEVESILANHGFIRIHQSHLINPLHLKSFIRNDGGYVIMEDGEKISVSKSNREKITAAFHKIDRA